MSDVNADRRVNEPSAKRRQDFRKRGEIALSRDLTMVGTVMGGAVGLMSSWAGTSGRFISSMRDNFGGLDQLGVGQLLAGAGHTFVGASAPTCVGAMVGFVAASGPQLGWPPVFRWPKADFARFINPESVWQIISPRQGIERVAKSLAKTAVVAGAALMALYIEWQHYLLEPVFLGPAIGQRLAAILLRLVMYGGGSLAALALFDFFISRRRMHAKMKMTTEETKREQRESEGDPQIRRRRRARARQLAKRRLGVAVKTADVVLVNPTEYAVALRFRTGEGGAPRVVAKGRLQQAERIREIARQNGIPILSRPPLTRLIYKLVAEGREVPANLFHAVAEVLAYVYRLTGRKAMAAAGKAGVGARVRPAMEGVR